jgi:hypothetical protein
MKRRFRQKQDLVPPDDPDKEKVTSGDDALENVNIDDVLKEIETLLEGSEDDPEQK